jgi:hypothetical protein
MITVVSLAGLVCFYAALVPAIALGTVAIIVVRAVDRLRYGKPPA